MKKMGEPKLKEALANYEHDRWSHWMTYFFSKCDIKKGPYNNKVLLYLDNKDFQRWQRQMKTAYQDLPENEKESDRDGAKKIIDLLKKLEEI